MLINKHDAVALIAIGSFAIISTAVVLPQIGESVKVALAKPEKTVTKSPMSTKITATNKNFGTADLVTAMLISGAVWAIVRD